MAVGDMVGALSSIASGSTLDVQPAGTEEWIIHNIYHEDDIELQFYDGANVITFDSELGSGTYSRFSFHCKNALRLRVKNNASSNKLIGYDGVISKT